MRPTPRTESESVDRLLDLVLAGDAPGAWSLVESIYREDGQSAFDVLSCLLGGVGIRLEEAWERDELSSVQLVVSVCQLRTHAIHLVSAASSEASARPALRTAVTWTPKGDRVSFGCVLHECCLELAGWHVEKFDGLPLRDVLDRLRNRDVDILLCVLEDGRLLEATCRGLRRFRESTPERDLFIAGVGRGFDRCARHAADCPITAFMGSANETLCLCPDPTGILASA